MGRSDYFDRNPTRSPSQKCFMKSQICLSFVSIHFPSLNPTGAVPAVQHLCCCLEWEMTCFVSSWCGWGWNRFAVLSFDDVPVGNYWHIYIQAGWDMCTTNSRWIAAHVVWIWGVEAVFSVCWISHCRSERLQSSDSVLNYWCLHTVLECRAGLDNEDVPQPINGGLVLLMDPSLVPVLCSQ